LEGLEATTNTFKSLERIIDYRIEAEYFDKRFLNNDLHLSKINSTQFFDIADYENGYAYSSEEFSEYEITNGVKVAKIGDVTNKRPNEEWSYLTRAEFDYKNGRLLVNDDVLMTLTGDPPDVGKVSIFFNDQIQSTWNQRVARIFLKEEQKVYLNQKVLYAILLNKYCREQLERFAKGIRQRNLGIECVERLTLPVFSNDFQKVISNTIQQYQTNIENSRNVYYRGQIILNKYMGLDNLLVTNISDGGCGQGKEGINCKTFKNSLLATGRLDAEYYQVKYEQIVNHITSQKYDYLINAVYISKSIEPGSQYYAEEGMPFYRVSDCNKYGTSKPDKNLSTEFCKDNEELIESLKPKKGTILFSKDGSVGNAYLLREDLNGITSGAILHLKVKDGKTIIPEYLTLVLNSMPVQMQAERDAGGSIIIHWRVSEIEKVVIPVIDYDKQLEIANLVEESFRLKKEAESLLEIAKSAVEIAIEEGEKKAMSYISKFVHLEN
jgi:type I restriction enzyme S subunit